MVTAANQRSACAEKSLKEANMAVEVLSGEVVALKAMVSSTWCKHPMLMTDSTATVFKKIQLY